MLSSTAEYALRAVVCLAQHGEQALTTHQIANATSVPAGYLAKVLHSLRKGGIVNSRRGVYGGFTLARPAAELSLLQVISAVDPFERIETCPLHLESHGKNLCPLHASLDKAMQLIEETFAGTNLASVLTDGHALMPLCEAMAKEAPSPSPPPPLERSPS